MHYKYIFCILVYRNTKDIVDCINSIKEKVDDYKIVMVNSFFDETSDREFAKIADENQCDYLTVENKGYSFGNNSGISYILHSYTFDYLVISNPDITIDAFDLSRLAAEGPHVVAPLIHAKNGKAQNPYWFKKNAWAEKQMYKGMKLGKSFYYYLGVAVNKLIRERGLRSFLASSDSYRQVYAAHGSFMLVSAEVFEKINPLYDDGMFLFAEEAYIAHLFEREGVRVYLTKDISISHKEDGSVGISSVDEMGELRRSIIYYYEKLGLEK